MLSVVVAGTDTFENCTTILRSAKQNLGEILSSYELMDSETMRAIKENVNLDNVLTTNPNFNLIVETQGLYLIIIHKAKSRFQELMRRMTTKR